MSTLRPRSSSSRSLSPGWPPELVRLALSRFALQRRGDHGPTHWARVRKHGVHLARIYGVSPVVPSLFALFHDCCRQEEYEDRYHGQRAAEFIEGLVREGHLTGLSSKDVDLLQQACAGHSEGLTEGPRVVQICWDADRLDLGRVGYRPDARRLCTDAAKDLDYRLQAYAWSRGDALWREAGDQEEERERFALAKVV